MILHIIDFVYRKFVLANQISFEESFIFYRQDNLGIFNLVLTQISEVEEEMLIIDNSSMISYIRLIASVLMPAKYGNIAIRVNTLFTREIELLRLLDVHMDHVVTTLHVADVLNRL